MESGTHAMEVITALIDGPLCFIVAFGAAHNHSYRHPLQIILCVMQLYGLLWFTLQPIYSDTGLAGHFSSDPVRFSVCYLHYTVYFCTQQLSCAEFGYPILFCATIRRCSGA